MHLQVKRSTTYTVNDMKENIPSSILLGLASSQSCERCRKWRGMLLITTKVLAQPQESWALKLRLTRQVKPWLLLCLTFSMTFEYTFGMHDPTSYHFWELLPPLTVSQWWNETLSGNVMSLKMLGQCELKVIFQASTGSQRLQSVSSLEQLSHSTFQGQLPGSRGKLLCNKVPTAHLETSLLGNV